MIDYDSNNLCIKNKGKDMDEDEVTDYIKEIFEEHNISPLHMYKVEFIVNQWC